MCIVMALSHRSMHPHGPCKQINASSWPLHTDQCIVMALTNRSIPPHSTFLSSYCISYAMSSTSANIWTRLAPHLAHVHVVVAFAEHPYGGKALNDVLSAQPSLSGAVHLQKAQEYRKQKDTEQFSCTAIHPHQSNCVLLAMWISFVYYTHLAESALTTMHNCWSSLTTIHT